MGLLLMPHSGHFCMDTTELPSKVSVWGAGGGSALGGKILDGPCTPMEEESPSLSWGLAVPLLPEARVDTRVCKVSARGLRVREGEVTKLLPLS